MTISEKILDELMKDYKNPEDLLGEDGILDQLKKALVEKALRGEMTYHLGYQKNQERPEGQSNTRNETGLKKIKTKTSEIKVGTPLHPKNRFNGFLIRSWGLSTCQGKV